MSDAVAIALIGMFRSWGEVFVQNLAVIVPAIGTAVIGWMTWRNNTKSAERTEKLKNQMALIEAQARRTKEETELQIKGAERKNYEAGIRTAENRASDLQRLRETFKAESTDVFMARTDGTDQNNQR